MKNKFSKAWRSSKQPRKQRKFRYHAPLHLRQKLVSATLDKKLRKELGVRSLPLRKGDEVMVMRGDFKKKTGSVTSVDLKSSKIYVDGIKLKKASGQEVEAALESSNLKIMKPVMGDARRIKKKRTVAKPIVKK